jgi:hypothetical protein
MLLLLLLLLPFKLGRRPPPVLLLLGVFFSRDLEYHESIRPRRCCVAIDVMVVLVQLWSKKKSSFYVGMDADDDDDDQKNKQKKKGKNEHGPR